MQKQDVLDSEPISQAFFCIVRGQNYAAAIQKKMRVKPPSIFRYISVLENAGFIEQKKEGRIIRYFPVWKKIAGVWCDLINNSAKEIENEYLISRKQAKHEIKADEKVCQFTQFYLRAVSAFDFKYTLRFVLGDFFSFLVWAPIHQDIAKNNDAFLRKKAEVAYQMDISKNRRLKGMMVAALLEDIIRTESDEIDTDVIPIKTGGFIVKRKKTGKEIMKFEFH